MHDDSYARIQANPRFQELVAKREDGVVQPELGHAGVAVRRVHAEQRAQQAKFVAGQAQGLAVVVNVNGGIVELENARCAGCWTMMCRWEKYNERYDLVLHTHPRLAWQFYHG